MNFSLQMVYLRPPSAILSVPLARKKYVEFPPEMVFWWHRRCDEHCGSKAQSGLERILVLGNLSLRHTARTFIGVYRLGNDQGC